MNRRTKAQPPKPCQSPTGHRWVNVSSDGNKKSCKFCGLTKFWASSRMDWVFQDYERR